MRAEATAETENRLNIERSMFIFLVNPSYEIEPEWDGFLMIRLAALAAGSRAEQRTAEYRITNIEFRSVELLRSIFL